jgi:response regulator of citrate/malate metabolism
MMIRVLLVDDNTQYARVFAFALDLQPDIEVVGIAGTLAEAREMLEARADRILNKIAPHDQVIATIRELGGGN